MIAVEAETGAFQMRFIPNRWLGIPHMGVVGKDDGAGFRFFPGNHPAVAADPHGHRQIGEYLMDGGCQSFSRLRIIGTINRDFLCTRRPAKHPVFQVVPAQFMVCLCYQRIHSKALGKPECHQGAGKVNILWREFFPGYAKYPEFYRCFSVFDKLIDARKVGQSCFLESCGWIFKICSGIYFRPFQDADGSKKCIGFDQFFSQNFSQTSGRHPSHHFHLEEALPGMHVTQRKIDIFFVLTINMRYAVWVKNDFDFLSQA